MSPDQTPAKVTPAAPREGQDRKLKPPPPPDHHVKCPRCDSPSTKFCYYNNYSLSQPRHFCKTCRRYWTKGGALRNVPIGGGCRKNKRTKQRLAGISNSRDSSSCEIMGSTGAAAGLNFFQGFLTPAMDFQLGSVNPPSSSSMFPLSGNFSSYDPCQVNSGHHPSSRAVGTLMGFDYLRSGVGGGDALAGTHQMGPSSNTANTSMIVHSNLASSIESLSSINQELHWKLQQQRLAVFFSENQDDQKRTTQAEIAPVDHQFDDQQQQTQTQNFLLQPILFQNLETRKEADPYSTGESRIDDSGRKSRLGNTSGLNNNGSTEWFFDVSPYANDGSNNSGGLDNNEGNNATVDDDNQNNNWNTGIQAWSDMQQYNGLP